jgi:hypothetical protein
MTLNERRRALIEAFRRLPERDQTALVELAESWARILGKQHSSRTLTTYPTTVNGKTLGE